MRTSTGPVSIIVAALLVMALWNVTVGLWQHAHRVEWPADDWDRLEQSFVHARSVLAALPDRHVEYRIEGATDTYDQAAYYRLQNILSPTILQHEPVPTRYVLIEFANAGKPSTPRDLTLIEDFGNGFALYRRQ